MRIILTKIPRFIYTALFILSLLIIVSLFLILNSNPNDYQNRIFFALVFTLKVLITIPLILSSISVFKKERVKYSSLFLGHFKDVYKFAIFAGVIMLLNLFDFIPGMIFWSLFIISSFLKTWGLYKRSLRKKTII
jgi:hypothetical protein